MRLASLSVVLLAVGPVWAAPPVTGPAAAAVELPVSANATVVIQVNGWGKARDRLTAVVEKAFPNDSKPIKDWINEKLPTLFDGREIKGIDPDARAYLAVNDLRGLGGDTFPADWFVPVKDAVAFRDGFFKDDERKDMVKKANGITAISIDGSPFFFVEKSGRVIITASEDRANEYAGKYELLNTKRMGADVAATFLNADLSLFVDLEKINDAFGDEIKQFRGLIDFAFQNAAGNIPGLDPSQMDAFKEMMKSMFQIVEDGRALVVGLEFRPEGLNLRVQGRFGKETKTGLVLAAEAPEKHAGLAQLPPGMTEYGARRFGPAVTSPIESLVREFAAGEEQEDAVKAVETYLGAKKNSGVRGTLTASHAPDTTLTILDCQDPSALVKAHIALLKVLPAGASHSTIVLKEKPAVKESAGTHKGIIFHQVSVVHDFEATVKKLPEAVREATLASMKQQGKEKATYWIGSDGERVIQIIAADWPAAQKLLDGMGQGHDGAFRTTRDQLPPEACLFAMQEVGHIIDSIAEQLGTVGQSVPGLPFELPKISKVKAGPAFVGMALVLKSEIGQFDLFVPAAAIGVVRKALEEK